MDDLFNLQISYKDGKATVIQSVYAYEKDAAGRFLKVSFEENDNYEVMVINLDDVREYRTRQFKKKEIKNDLD